MTSLAHFIYVAEGFMEDCKMLIKTLTDKYEMVDWTKFCVHWKELQFDLMFYNRRSGAELVELTEECFQCARLYMITETDNYEDQVVGIFIAYALSLIQPYKNLCTLRLVPEDVGPMKKVEAKARLNKRKDVLMILGRLYVYSTQYHVCTRERAMDYRIRKYFDGSIRVPKTIVRDWHGGLDRTNVRNWRKIHQMEKSVMESIKSFTAYSNREHPALRLEDRNIIPVADNIADSLQNLIMCTKQEKEPEETGMDSVKKKAMRETVNPVRHFIPIDQRQAAAGPLRPAPVPTTSQRKTVIKSVRSKIKENSQNVIVGKELQQYTELKMNFEPKIEAELDELPPPSLDNRVIQDPEVDEVNLPGSPFLGFTAEEIESTYASLSNSDLESSPMKKRKKKLKNGKQLSTSHKTSHTDLDNSDLEIPKLSNVQKRKATPRTQVKNKKKRGNKLFDESDSNTNDSTFDSNLSNDGCEIKTKETIKAFNTLNQIPTEEIKVEDLVKREFNDKELEANPNGVKNFVQYKVKDIVIHADQGLPDLEFELIDQYTGPVNKDKTAIAEGTTVRHADLSLPDLGFESIDQNTGPVNKVKTAKKTESTVRHADLSLPNLGSTVDTAISENGKPENTNGEKEPIHIEDDGEEMVEVVRILTESEAAMIETRESLIVPRRQRKRPSLRSKLKRMGILPVANFYNDDVEGS